MKENIRIEFEIPTPDGDITYDQIYEWIRYELHDNGGMDLTNPLVDKEISPIIGTLTIAFRDKVKFIA